MSLNCYLIIANVNWFMQPISNFKKLVISQLFKSNNFNITFLHSFINQTSDFLYLSDCKALLTKPLCYQYICPLANNLQTWQTEQTCKSSGQSVSNLSKISWGKQSLSPTGSFFCKNWYYLMKYLTWYYHKISGWGEL